MNMMDMCCGVQGFICRQSSNFFMEWLFLSFPLLFPLSSLSFLPPSRLPFFISTSLIYGSPLVTTRESFSVLKIGVSPYQSLLFPFPIPLPTRKTN